MTDLVYLPGYNSTNGDATFINYAEDHSSKFRSYNTSLITHSVTQTHFGSTSISFPNTTNRGLITSENITLDSGDFTMALWAYHEFGNDGAWRQLCSFKDPGIAGGGAGIRWATSGVRDEIQVSLNFADAAAIYNPAVDKASLANGWHHYAFVRKNNVCKLYIDGVQQTMSLWTSTSRIYTEFTDVTNNNIGTANFAVSAWQGYGDIFYGFMEDVVLTNTALYDGNFTVPAAPYKTPAHARPYDELVFNNASNLQAYYTFDDAATTASDISGNARNLTLNSMTYEPDALVTDTDYCIKNVALQTSYANYNTWNINSNITSGTITLEGWFSVTTLPETAECALVGWTDLGNGTVGSDWGFRLSSNGQVSFSMWGADSTSHIIYGRPITLDEPFYLCVVATLTGHKFYQNGILVGTDSYTGGMSTAGPRDDFVIHRIRTNGGDTPGVFKADNIAVYNTQLTAQEIEDRYYAGLGGNPDAGSYYEQIKSLNPKIYWPLWEPSGTTAYDHSGNGFHGTYQGTVTPNQTGYVLDAQGIAYPSTLISKSTATSGILKTDALPAGTTQFTVECWFYYSLSGSYNTFYSLHAYQNAGAQGEFQTLMDASSANLYIRYDFFQNAAGGNQVWGGAGIPEKKWTHLVVSYDLPNGRYKCYVNGEIYIDYDAVALSVPALVYPSLDEAYNFILGNDQSYGHAIGGYMQHAALYDYILTGEQILANYNKGISAYSLLTEYPRPPITTGLRPYEDMVINSSIVPTYYWPLNPSDEFSTNLMTTSLVQATPDYMGRSPMIKYSGLDLPGISTNSPIVNGYEVGSNYYWNGTVDQGWTSYEAATAQGFGADSGMAWEALTRVHKDRIGSVTQIATRGGITTTAWSFLFRMSSGNFWNPHINPTSTILGYYVKFSTTIHAVQIFRNSSMSFYINGFKALQQYTTSVPYYLYPTSYGDPIRTIIGCRPGNTERLKGEVAHFATYNYNPVGDDYPPFVPEFRKRFLRAAGFDYDNETNEYRNLIKSRNPLYYWPMSDGRPDERQHVAYHIKNQHLNAVTWNSSNKTTPDLHEGLSTIDLNTYDSPVMLGGDFSRRTIHSVSHVTNGANPWISIDGGASKLTELEEVWTNGDWSFEGWYNIEAVKTTVSGQFGVAASSLWHSSGPVNTDSTSTNVLMILLLKSDGSILYFHEYSSGTNVSYTTPAGIFPFNQTVHLAVTMEGLTLKFYINSIQVASTTVSAKPTIAAGSSIFHGIGWAWESTSDLQNSYSYSGRTQSVAVYDYSMTQAQIRENYSVGSGLDPYAADNYSDLIVSDSPIAYFRANETTGNLKDFINPIQSTVTGTATYEQTGAIDGNLAVYLNSTTWANLNVNTSDSDSFTIEAWMKYDGTNSATIGRGLDSAGLWSAELLISYNTLRFRLTSTASVTWQTTVNVPANFWDGDYHHYVWIFNRNNLTQRLYIDSIPVEISTQGSFANLRASTVGWHMAIGLDGIKPASYTGTYDEVAIYNRVLTFAEIQEHYYTAKGITSTYIGIVLEQEDNDTDRIRFARNFDFEKDVVPTSYLTRNPSVTGTYLGGLLANGPALRKESTRSLNCTGTNGQGIDYGSSENWAQFGTTDPNFAIETWFTIGSKTTDHRILACDGDNTNGFEVGCWYESGSQAFGIAIKDGGVLSKCYIITSSLQLDTPIHAIIVVKPTYIEMFINGKSVALTSGLSLTDFNGTNNCAIGFAPGATLPLETSNPQYGRNWDGYIDTVLILADHTIDETVATERYLAGTLASNYQQIKDTLRPALYMNFDGIISSPLVDEINNIAFTVNPYTNVTYTSIQDEFINNSIQSNNATPSEGTTITGTYGIYSQNISHLAFTTNNTFSLWINVQSSTIARANPIYGTFAISGSYGGITLNAPCGASATKFKVQVIQFRGASYIENVNFSSVEDFDVDTWYHVTVKLEISGGTHTYRVFVNGVEITYSTVNSTTNGLILYGTPTGMIGTTVNATTNQTYRFANAKLDELMHFNYALSDQQILDLYNSTGTEYRVYGTVTQDNVPVQRRVRIYRRSDGVFIKEIQSDPITGLYELRWRELYPDTEYFAIAFDDDVTPNLEAIIRDRIVPEPVV